MQYGALDGAGVERKCEGHPGIHAKCVAGASARNDGRGNFLQPSENALQDLCLMLVRGANGDV